MLGKSVFDEKQKKSNQKNWKLQNLNSTAFSLLPLYFPELQVRNGINSSKKNLIKFKLTKRPLKNNRFHNSNFNDNTRTRCKVLVLVVKDVKRYIYCSMQSDLTSLHFVQHFSNKCLQHIHLYRCYHLFISSNTFLSQKFIWISEKLRSEILWIGSMLQN